MEDEGSKEKLSKTAIIEGRQTLAKKSITGKSVHEMANKSDERKTKER